MKRETRPMVTMAMLERHAACEEQLYIFERIFGEQAELTVENVMHANANDLNLEFLLADVLKMEFDSERLWRHVKSRDRYVYNMPYILNLLFEPAR